MPVKDILLHLDGSPRCSVRAGIAARLAARHGAHLTGLHVLDLPPPDMFYGFPAAFLDLQRAEDIVAQLRGVAAEDARTVEASFRELLRRDGLAGDWRLAEGLAGETVARYGRCADLIVVGQPDPRGGTARTVDLPVTTLMASGRPLLMVPFAGAFPVLGERVLVGWNASAEAARAVAEALPLLAMAKHVTVLSINPAHDGDGDPPASDVVRHLAHHGIAAEAAHTVATDIAEGDALLSYAADISADLLVTGMYGRSRARETLFGGVTRTLLTEMTIPVFMSH